MIVVAALYKFVNIADTLTLRERLLTLMRDVALKGTLIIAREGINGTVAGSREGIDTLKAFLDDDGRFGGLEYKESLCDEQPFKFSKVTIKPEIVTLKVDVDPIQNVGTYVDAAAWNRLLEDPEVTVVDVRNDFEVNLGSFKNAINPQTKAFSDFPAFVRENLSPQVHKKIAMACTGGIRCEKASSLMKMMGFDEVYHLKGGILQYLHDTPPEKSLWHGECFVFDERITVDHDLKPRAPHAKPPVRGT